MNVLIIYETQTGTTEFVANAMAEYLQTKQHQVTVHSVRQKGTQPVLDGIDLILFGSPTYDYGTLEHYMQEFVESFSADLSKHKFAVFSLGNSSFPMFCASAEILEEWVKKNNGAVAIPSLKIDGYPAGFEEIGAWLDQLIA